MRRFALVVVLGTAVCGCDTLIHPKPVAHLLPNVVEEPVCKEPKHQDDRYFQGFHYAAGDYCRFPWEHKPYSPS